MTREERLGWLKRIEKDIYVCSLESTFEEDSKSCAIHSTIEELEKSLKQEQDKPMVEIDLYSVIKQKYIEREVLDEIRSEIEEQVLESLSDGGDDWFTAEKVNECLEIIDKYMVESEE